MKTLEIPSFINMLFSDKDKGFSILWLSLWSGVQWIKSGLRKLSSLVWMQTGEALKGFWT